MTKMMNAVISQAASKAAKKVTKDNLRGVVTAKKNATFIFAVDVPAQYHAKKCDMLSINGATLKSILKTTQRNQKRAGLAAEYSHSYISVAITRGRISRKVVKMLEKEGIPSYTYVTYDPKGKVATMDTVSRKQFDEFIVTLMEKNTAMAKAIVR